MKKRKLIALVLALVLCLSAVVPAFAAIKEPDVEPHACVGGCNYQDTGDAYESGSYVYRTKTAHAKRLYQKRQCVTCNRTIEVVTDDFGDNYRHTSTVTNYTCDGTVQTWHNYCSVCKGTWLTTYTCPGGPHPVGQCSWLPG